jgi:DNA modification methylase
MPLPKSVYELLTLIASRNGRMLATEIPATLKNALDICRGKPLLVRVARVGTLDAPAVAYLTSQGRAELALYAESDEQRIPAHESKVRPEDVPIGSLGSGHVEVLVQEEETGKSGKGRRPRGRPRGSDSAENDRKLYHAWKDANGATGITKAEFLRERGLPVSYLAAIERGRAQGKAKVWTEIAGRKSVKPFQIKSRPQSDAISRRHFPASAGQVRKVASGRKSNIQSSGTIRAAAGRPSRFQFILGGVLLMHVELRDINDIKPYPNNPRHNDHAIDAVAASILAFGFRQPLVVDEEGMLVVGDTRWKAAKKLGLAVVPVHVAVGLTPAQCKAYRIADNKSAELADWNDDLLVQELADLQKLDFDLDLLGFSADELNHLLDFGGGPGLVDPDDVPEPPDEPTTRPGDRWVLGNHHLLCGDATKPEDVDRLLDGATVQLVNTDPPYNVKVEPRSNNAIAAGLSSFAGTTSHQGLDVARHPNKAKPTTKKLRAKDRPLTNDFVSDKEFDRLLNAWFGNLTRVLQRGRGFYIWGGYANIANYPAVLKAHDLYMSQTIIWDKQHAVLTRKDYMGAHEWCFYGWKLGAAHQFFGPNNATDLWAIKKVNPQSMVHLTEKPVELAARALEYSSRFGENVLDLFGGSGSTLIAAEQTGRRAFLMELDGLYCDVIVQRWERFTGKKAQRRCAGAS